MGKLYKIAFIMVISIGCLACTSVRLHEDNKPVQITLSEVELEDMLDRGCEYRGFLVSSYGNWYNYLFLSNMQLSSGAMDDMYNKANEVGANVVYVRNIDFTTSVTYIGEAYYCKFE